MKLFQKILVPVDVAAPRASLLELVGDIAHRYRAAVTLLHVFDAELFATPDRDPLLDPKALARTTKPMLEELQHDRAELARLGVSEIDTALIHGEPHEQIVEFARLGAFDLIVMGTHGRVGFSHAMLGSIAERVMRTAPCAVLTAHLPPTAAVRDVSAVF